MTDSELARRIDRLEAAEEVRGRFAAYTMALDAGRVADVVDCFAPGATLVVTNWPLGSGETVEADTPEAIADFYDQTTGSTFRHHTTNTTLDVSPDATEARLSSYFAVSANFTWTGGIYEGTFVRCDDGDWRFAQWRISSTWGWKLRSERPPFLDEAPGRGTLGDASPVRWNRTYL